MRKVFNQKLNKFRANPPHMPEYHSEPSYGPNGLFYLRNSFDGGKTTTYINVIASSGDEMYPWEHVSVTIRGEDRCPTWEEMCYVKDMFWDEDEWVMQLHPPKRKNISFHPFCLHLWKPHEQAGIIPTPPPETVGPINPNESADGQTTTVPSVPKRFTDDQASVIIDAYVNARNNRTPLPGDM